MTCRICAAIGKPPEVVDGLCVHCRAARDEGLEVGAKVADKAMRDEFAKQAAWNLKNPIEEVGANGEEYHHTRAVMAVDLAVAIRAKKGTP